MTLGVERFGRSLRRLVLVVAVGALGAGALLPAAGAQAGTPWWEPTAPQTPDSRVDVTGAPFTGTAPDGTVRGFVDTHTHLMSDVGFGGDIVCGATFSEDGVGDALQDCDYHQLTGGRGALIENLTHLEAPGTAAPHDTTGWPTFRDWPKWSSLTHQQMYYRWVERSWRAGQRVMVADAVNNNVLCSLPTQPRRYSCDDMATVRRQIAETKKLEAFVDARYGGSGKGWFRIAYSQAQARQIVEQGKLAVILGVEVSNPFGCTTTLGIPRCTKAQIDRGLDELRSLGVSSMFLCHKFDNALCGVRYDEGTQGVIVNLGNFLNTGRWWQARPCAPGQVPDNTVSPAPLPAELARLFPLAVVPAYGPGPHCNPIGLTSLGEYALKGMMARGMVVEVDHMSAKAADRALTLMEQVRYPGVVSSHSWLAPAYTERVYALGGFLGQYGHGAEEFVETGHDEAALRAKYGVGYGFGMDMNGFGGTPPPRTGAAQANPVTYPFTTVDGGSTVDRQVSGQRVWDVNTDGVAHYGMIPDWVQDMRQIGGEDVVQDLARGAESYLRTLGAAQSRGR